VHKKHHYPAPRTPPSARAIIDGEQRSLESVLQALRCYVGPLRHHRVRPDCEVFATIPSYIETFADRFHHPKGDEFLFRANRDPFFGIGAHGTLGSLMRQAVAMA